MADPISGTNYGTDKQGAFDRGVNTWNLASTTFKTALRATTGLDLPSLPYSSFLAPPKRFSEDAVRLSYQGEAANAVWMSASHVALDWWIEGGVKDSRFTGTILEVAGSKVSLGTLLQFAHLGSSLSHPWSDTVASRSLTGYFGSDPAINWLSMGHSVLAASYASTGLYANFGRAYWFVDARLEYSDYNNLVVQQVYEDAGSTTEDVPEYLVAQAVQTIQEGGSTGNSSQTDLRVLSVLAGCDYKDPETCGNAIDAVITESMLATYDVANQLEAINRFLNGLEMTRHAISLESAYRLGYNARLNLRGDANFKWFDLVTPLAQPAANLGIVLANYNVKNESYSFAEIAIPAAIDLSSSYYAMFSAYVTWENHYAGLAADRAWATLIRSSLRPLVHNTLLAVSPIGYIPEKPFLGIPTQIADVAYRHVGGLIDARSVSQNTRLAIENGLGRLESLGLYTAAASVLAEGATTFVATRKPQFTEESQDYLVLPELEVKNPYASDLWKSYAISTLEKGVGVGLAFGLEALENNTTAGSFWNDIFSNDNRRPGFALLPENAADAIASTWDNVHLTPTWSTTSGWGAYAAYTKNLGGARFENEQAKEPTTGWHPIEVGPWYDRRVIWVNGA